MNLEPLVEELKKPEYAGKSDEECASLILEKKVLVRSPLPLAKVRKGMIEIGLWSALSLCSEDRSESVDRRKLAITVLALVDEVKSGSTKIDLDSPVNQALLGQLVAEDFCTQDEADALLASVNRLVPWGSHVGLGTVGLGYVKLARKG